VSLGHKNIQMKTVMLGFNTVSLGAKVQGCSIRRLVFSETTEDTEDA